MKDLKEKLSHFFKSSFINYWPFIILFFIVFSFFWRVFLRDEIPLPADILVRGNYPVKNPIVSDAVSFSYPMRYLTIKMIKNGLWPLWNPYILFGTPLLANFQSAAFSITNIFYFLSDFLTGWSLQIIFQHVLAAFFSYILFRHWGRSKGASILGAVIFAFSGFNLIWSQWNAHTLTAAFIPLLVFFSDRFLKNEKTFDGIFLSIILALQIFSGYPQIILYTIPTIFLLWLVRFKKLDKRFVVKGILLFVFVLIGIGIAAPQVLPGIELLSLSQRKYEAIPRDWVFLSWRQLITFIAPDYFGNHATANYWGPKNYTSVIGYVGVVAFSLAASTLKLIKKSKEVFYLILLSAVSLVLSFPTLPAIFLWQKDILGLQAGASYRILVLFIFAMSALSAFGFDYIKLSKPKSYYKFLLVPLLILVSYGTAALILLWQTGLTKYVVGLRNLVLPFTISVILILSLRFKLKFILIFLALLELFYFGWKFTPFSPREIVFPRNAIVDYLENIEKPFRVEGDDTMPVDTGIVYGLEFAGGYDAVYPLRTAKLIAVLNSNDVDASPQDRYGLISNKKSRLLDLTNTRFFLDRGEIIENKKYLPRAFMIYDWEVIKDDKGILNKLLDQRFSIDKKIVLEENTSMNQFVKVPRTINKVEYISYKEQESIVRVETSKDGLLFVSDSWYPGWKAYIDGIETKIYRADYAFRAIPIPSGKHEVRLVYNPKSFNAGLKISLLSFVVLFGFMPAILRRLQ